MSCGGCGVGGGRPQPGLRREARVRRAPIVRNGWIRYLFGPRRLSMRAERE